MGETPQGTAEEARRSRHLKCTYSGKPVPSRQKTSQARVTLTNQCAAHGNRRTSYSGPIATSSGRRDVESPGASPTKQRVGWRVISDQVVNCKSVGLSICQRDSKIKRKKISQLVENI